MSRRASKSVGGFRFEPDEIVSRRPDSLCEFTEDLELALKRVLAEVVSVSEKWMLGFDRIQRTAKELDRGNTEEMVKYVVLLSSVLDAFAPVGYRLHTAPGSDDVVGFFLRTTETYSWLEAPLNVVSQKRQNETKIVQDDRPGSVVLKRLAARSTMAKG